MVTRAQHIDFSPITAAVHYAFPLTVVALPCAEERLSNMNIHPVSGTMQFRIHQALALQAMTAWGILAPVMVHFAS